MKAFNMHREESRKGVALFVIVALSLIIFLYHFTDNIHRSAIVKWSIENEYEIKSIETPMWDYGPYWVKGEDQTIYKITLSDGRTFWMRTGIFDNEYVEYPLLK